MKDFFSLFIKELRDLYDTEQQMVKLLPELAKAAHFPSLKEAFHSHLKETKEQIKRLEKIAIELRQELTGGQNEVMKSFLKEKQKIANAHFDPIVRDVALVNLAQRIEHYEIATYGSLKAFAKHLKMTDVFNMLDDSSREEGNMNKTLNAIAEGTLFQKGVNDKACEKCA